MPRTHSPDAVANALEAIENAGLNDQNILVISDALQRLHQQATRESDRTRQMEALQRNRRRLSEQAQRARRQNLFNDNLTLLMTINSKRMEVDQLQNNLLADTLAKTQTLRQIVVELEGRLAAQSGDESDGDGGE
tara:strand:- start:255 stop:659 length:405 start_codon:yes stop_codon:yes gene_type:complete